MAVMHSFGLEDHYTSKIFAKGLKSGKNEDEKSFNRYVRQLVDQYLDKEVVISKQPEDKVELIVQACREKFPEFAHWTTTRIRIYIESCRRLKKIKNSPLLLAKRKAAGRRFREGQKLKKIIASQYSMQAAEANRQLAEYLIRNGTVNHAKPKSLSPFSPHHQIEEHSIGTVKTEGVQIKTEVSTSPYLDGKDTSPYSQIPNMNLQNQSINPVLSSLMKIAPSVLQSPSFLERHGMTSSNESISKLSPINLGGGTTLLPTMAPTFNPTQVVPPRVVSPRTPTASPPTMMSNTLFNKPKIFTASQVPTNEDHEMDNTQDTTVDGSVSDAIGKVISAMLQNEKSKQGKEEDQQPNPSSPPKITSWSTSGSPVQQERQTVSSLSSPPQLSPKQKSFQIESLMNSSVQDSTPGTTVCSTSPLCSASPLRLPLLPEKQAMMSMTEIMNAKTLVTSYREAANFLYRAASELEQLLPTDHRVF